jgi:hypothetical protein
MGLFSKQTSTSTQTSNYFDSSANAGGDDSVALGSGAKLDLSNRSTNVGGAEGSMNLSNSSLEINTVTDQGAMNAAKELSLASLNLAGKQTSDLKEYVQSNQQFARSIAETALAKATGEPLPATSNKLLYVGAALVAFVLFLVFRRRSSA